MKVEAERYRSLSDEEEVVDALAASMGWALEDARDLYRTNLGLARFLATTLHR